MKNLNLKLLILTHFFLNTIYGAAAQDLNYFDERFTSEQRAAIEKFFDKAICSDLTQEIIDLKPMTDGNRFVTLTQTGIVTIWDTFTRQKLGAYSQEDTIIKILPVYKDRLALITQSCDLIYFNINTNTVLDKHNIKVAQVLIANYDNAIVIAFGNQIQIFGINDSEKLYLMKGKTVENAKIDSMITLKHKNIGTLIYTDSVTNSIHFENNKSLILQLPEPKANLLPMQLFALSNDLICATNVDGESFFIYNLENNSLYVFDYPIKPDMHKRVAFMVEHNILAIIAKQTIKLFKFNPEPGGDTKIKPYDTIAAHTTNIEGIRCAGNKYLNSFNNLTMKFWDLTKEYKKQQKPPHQKYKIPNIETILPVSQSGYALRLKNGSVKLIGNKLDAIAKQTQYLTYFKQVKRINAHRQKVVYLSFTDDGNLISGAFGEGLIKWNVINLSRVEYHSDAVIPTTNSALSFKEDESKLESDDRFLIYRAFGDRIIVFDQLTNEKVACIDGHEGYITDMSKICKSGIITASLDGTVKIWKPGDISQGRSRLVTSIKLEKPVYSVATTKNSDIIAAGLENGEIVILEKVATPYFNVHDLHENLIRELHPDLRSKVLMDLTEDEEKS